MKLFIQNIQKTTTRTEIIMFVANSLRSSIPVWPFNKPRGEVTACEIYRVTDPVANTVEYYAVASVLPDQAGELAIKRLNGQALNQRRVLVRQFFDRASTDRRFRDLDSLSSERPVDRRRNNLIVEVHTPSKVEFEAYAHMAREHG